MAKKYIPKSGDKFKVFVKLSAFQGELFTCTGRCQKNYTSCIQAKNSKDKKPHFAFNRHIFVFERA